MSQVLTKRTWEDGKLDGVHKKLKLCPQKPNGDFFPITLDISGSTTILGRNNRNLDPVIAQDLYVSREAANVVLSPKGDCAVLTSISSNPIRILQREQQIIYVLPKNLPQDVYPGDIVYLGYNMSEKKPLYPFVCKVEENPLSALEQLPPPKLKPQIQPQVLPQTHSEPLKTRSDPPQTHSSLAQALPENLSLQNESQAESNFDKMALFLNIPKKFLSDFKVVWDQGFESLETIASISTDDLVEMEITELAHKDLLSLFSKAKRNTTTSSTTLTNSKSAFIQVHSSLLRSSEDDYIHSSPMDTTSSQPSHVQYMISGESVDLSEISPKESGNIDNQIKAQLEEQIIYMDISNSQPIPTHQQTITSSNYLRQDMAPASMSQSESKDHSVLLAMQKEEQHLKEMLEESGHVLINLQKIHKTPQCNNSMRSKSVYNIYLFPTQRRLSVERRTESCCKELSKKYVLPEITVVVMGDRKTSTLNALLGEELPTAGMRVCTAVEIAYNNPDFAKSKYVAEIEFKTVEEWGKELKVLFHNMEGDETDINADSQAGVALTKLCCVYQTKDLKTIKYLANRTNHISRLLGIVHQLNDNEPAAFRKNIEVYADSDKEAKLAYWPLVKRIRLRGPWDILRSGVILVDAPRVCDDTSAHVQVVKNYLEDSDSIFIAFVYKAAACRRYQSVMCYCENLQHFINDVLHSDGVVPPEMQSLVEFSDQIKIANGLLKSSKVDSGVADMYSKFLLNRAKKSKGFVASGNRDNSVTARQVTPNVVVQEGVKILEAILQVHEILENLLVHILPEVVKSLTPSTVDLTGDDVDDD